MEPTVIAEHVFALGLCVPKSWSDKQIEQWINKKHRASFGDCQWHLAGQKNDCENNTNFIHVWVQF